MATEVMSFNVMHAERLRHFREMMSELLFQKPAALSLGGACSLLIEAWDYQHSRVVQGVEGIVVPMLTVEQLREWASAYPRKGRIRAREPGAPPPVKHGRRQDVRGLPAHLTGHRLRRLAADPQVRQCTKCGHAFQPDDNLLTCAYADKPDDWISAEFHAHLAANPVEWLPEGGAGPSDPNQEARDPD